MTRIPAYEVIELHGELAIALWNAGNPLRAVVALRNVVKELLTHWEPDDPRFREVYRKAMHVMGWYAPLAVRGVTPTRVSGGGEYTAPAPGIFSRKRPQLADLTTPMWKGVLSYNLGRILAGHGLRESALDQLEIAIRESHEKEFWWLRGISQLIAAPIASSLGYFRDALTWALDGTKVGAISSKLFKAEQNPMGIPLDIEIEWSKLSAAERAEAQSELLWITVVPWLVCVLIEGNNQIAIEAWKQNFTSKKDELVDPDHWDLILDAFALVVTPERRGDIVTRINSFDATQADLLYVHYFALLRSIGLLPSDATRVQGALLAQLLRRMEAAPVTLRDLGHYLLRFWQVTAETKGFQLRSPSIFRDRMKALRTPVELPSVCQIMLWAEEASGVTLPSEIRSAIAARVR